MHILILASTPNVAEGIRTALGDTADRYTYASTWSDVFLLLKGEHPDLIIVERTVLDRIELAGLLTIADPGRWPPLLLVDAPVVGVRDAIVASQRLRSAVPDYYQVGDLRIDTRKRRVKLEQRWVTLPPIQYRLVLALAQREGEVVGCQDLVRTVWGYEARESEARELVKVHVRQIRRRLGLNPEEQLYLRTVRGFGYMLVAPGED